ncbi:MAG TPA: signal recognition particle-docking protein FtsY [Desulfobacterales bacterium]|nr:signal recognition particle-docking protein FtsY [Desulfobacterales bacterium]
MLGWFKKKKEKNKAAATVDHQEPQAAVSSPSAAAAAPPPEAQSEGLFKRLKNGLHKTRESLVKRVDALFLGKKKIDAELLDELEEVLITADLGVQTVTEMLEEARNQVARRELADISALRAFLQDKMTGYLSENYKPAEKPDSGPFVIMVLGVNGVGKTTTIGKLAHKFKESGNKVLLVAADTFRAAAIDQLKIWGERTGVEVSAQKPGADPSSVVFDALEYAGSRDFDVILVDTAGRLHTQVNLIEELKKIKRVMNRKCPGAPHEVMLVLDATTGQNALSQTKLFNEAVELTALTLTKLDGTAKGGIVVNICREFSIPIRFIGVGEQMTDLRDFDAHDFIKAIFT